MVGLTKFGHPRGPTDPWGGKKLDGAIEVWGSLVSRRQKTRGSPPVHRVCDIENHGYFSINRGQGEWGTRIVTPQNIFLKENTVYDATYSKIQ